MRYVTFFAVFVVSVSAAAIAGCRQAADEATAEVTTEVAHNAEANSNEEEFDGRQIERTEDEWRALLTAEQFRILREEGTERPFSGEYNKHKGHGHYHCAACDLKLFSSEAKFDSGTGWPSFYKPVSPGNVVEKEDRAYGIVRTEVECARCGSHLGHVFEDGPEPTGLRYCMNSLALTFKSGGR